MINLEKDTPVEYSRQSRDYQVFVHLYNIVFNNVKMYAELLKNIWNDNIDDRLLDLRSYTLNFIPKYKWDVNDLRGLTNNFRYLLRSKGTRKALEDALEILARIKGISLPPNRTLVEITDDWVVKLFVSEDIDDIGEFEDVLRYILPAGALYEIIKYSSIDTNFVEDIVVDDYITSEGDSKSRSGKKYKYKSSSLTITSEGTHVQGVIPRNWDNPALPISIVNYDIGQIVTDGSEGL